MYRQGREAGRGREAPLVHTEGDRMEVKVSQAEAYLVLDSTSHYVEWADTFDAACEKAKRMIQETDGRVYPFLIPVDSLMIGMVELACFTF